MSKKADGKSTKRSAAPAAKKPSAKARSGKSAAASTKPPSVSKKAVKPVKTVVAKAKVSKDKARQQDKGTAVKGAALVPAASVKRTTVITVSSGPARTIAVSKAATPRKTEGLKTKMAPRAKIADIVLPPGYRPTEDEPFMNDMHKAYFRKRLLEWKEDILRQTRETLAILHEDSTQHADLADRATSETDRATELRTRDRQRKLVQKIDAALGRIEDGSYGYCEDTGEPIGLKRLDARPIATLSVEAQERHERRERVYREE